MPDESYVALFLEEFIPRAIVGVLVMAVAGLLGVDAVIASLGAIVGILLVGLARA